MPLLLAYSPPIHFWKKLVFPWREIEIIQGNRLLGLTINVRLLEGNHKVVHTEFDVLTHDHTCVRIQNGGATGCRHYV
jgi:hypothetical protein